MLLARYAKSHCLQARQSHGPETIDFHGEKPEYLEEVARESVEWAESVILEKTAYVERAKNAPGSLWQAKPLFVAWRSKEWEEHWTTDPCFVEVAIDETAGAVGSIDCTGC